MYNYFIAVGVLVPLFLVHFVVLRVHLNFVYLYCMFIIRTLSDTKLVTNIFSWLGSFSQHQTFDIDIFAKF